MLRKLTAPMLYYNLGCNMQLWCGCHNCKIYETKQAVKRGYQNNTKFKIVTIHGETGDA